MAKTTESPQKNAKQSPQNETADELAASAAEGMLGPNPFVGLRACDIVATAQKIATQALRQPALVMEQEAAFAREVLKLFSGGGDATPPKGDKRFTDAAWQNNFMYRATLQGYLAWRDALAGFVERSALDPANKERAKFVMSLFTDAASPTNTLLGNPAALKKVVDTGGASPLRGF